AHSASLSQVNCRFIKASVPTETLNQQIQPPPTLLSTEPRPDPAPRGIVASGPSRAAAGRWRADLSGTPAEPLLPVRGIDLVELPQQSRPFQKTETPPDARL